MTENYLSVLEESLEKKLQIMAKIQEYTLCQQEIFQAESADLEKYDEYVDKKDALVDELTALDNGFETLYRNVAGELEANRGKYAEQIRRLQALVTRVTEESVAIQTQEARNKKLVEDYFHRERSNITQSRKTSKAAYDYYRRLSGSSISVPRNYDNRK